MPQEILWPTPLSMHVVAYSDTPRLLATANGWLIGYYSRWNQCWTTGAQDAMHDDIAIQGKILGWLPLPPKLTQAVE